MADPDRPTWGFTGVYVPLEARTRFNEAKGVRGVHETAVVESCLEIVCGGNGFGYLISGATA